MKEYYCPNCEWFGDNKESKGLNICPNCKKEMDDVTRRRIKVKWIFNLEFVGPNHMTSLSDLVELKKMIRSQLKFAENHLMDNGLATGDTECEVEEWNTILEIEKD